jgi:hypothetical protein
LLGYNLNFVPTPANINKKEILEDVKKFNRKIKLKAHFETSLPEGNLYFKNESNWTPNNVHHTVKTFTDDFTNRVTQSINKDGQNVSSNRKNLSKNETKALNDLKNREDIIISKADKGGACVIMDVDNYISEADRQLKDERFYRKVDENPTSLHAALVDNAIDDLKQKGLLEEKMANQLKTSNPKTPRLYLLPKIHKPGNPGRPVVSSIGCHTEKISQFVDHHLQSLNQNLPSHVKDTTDFLRKLNEIPEIPDDSILVTMDVRSLYTNVPNDEGIEAVKSFLQKRNRPGDGALARIIATLLRLILTLNNFVFNDQNYIQVNGASMGTKCAPTYASLFMGKFEETYIIPKIRNSIMMYVRYIDDIFLIWKGSEEDLNKFLIEINEVHHSIKFDHELSRKSVNFLDCKVSLTGNRLSSAVFTKPTDRKSYLHAKSYHPKSTKEAIAYGQATRIRRICTDDKDFWEAADKLRNDLVKRGYRDDQITKEIQRAAAKDRNELMVYKERERNNRTPLVVTFNRRLPRLKELIDESWSILGINEPISRKFTEKPLICYRRNPNLREILGQNRISDNRVVKRKPETTGGCSPCRARPDTKCCNHVVRTKTFTDRLKKKHYSIRQKLGCKSKDALYLAWCDRCNDKQYVGKVESQKAHRRINKHRNDSKKEGSIGIDLHFREPNHSFDDFRIIIIEEITSKNMTREQIRHTLLKREDFWISKLNTLEPHGFNDKLNFTNA